MDPSVALRICCLCQQPRRRLFAFPRGQALAEACAICWLANVICHLSSQVADSDVALESAEGLLELAYRDLRERLHAREGDLQ